MKLSPCMSFVTMLQRCFVIGDMLMTKFYWVITTQNPDLHRNTAPHCCVSIFMSLPNGLLYPWQWPSSSSPACLSMVCVISHTECQCQHSRVKSLPRALHTMIMSDCCAGCASQAACQLQWTSFYSHFATVLFDRHNIGRIQTTQHEYQPSLTN